MVYKNKHQISIYKVIKLQLSLGIACSIIVSLITRSFNSTISSMLGFAVAFMATLAYIAIAFSTGKVAYPKVILRRHQKAILLRFLITLVLFTLVFVWYKQCNFIVLFITYFVTLSGYWFSLAKFK